MKYLFLFFSFLPMSLFSQILVTSDIFEITYSQEYEQPLKVEYIVMCDIDDVKNSRKGMDFYTCDSIHTSDDKDYYNNVWDKGHMAPAAAFNCDVDNLRQTFTYLNCALQHQDLNRRTWRYLEQYEKKLTEKGRVKVRVDILFEENSKRLPTGAVVPEGFRKTIWVNDQFHGLWYFPNESIKTTHIYEYKLK